MSETKLSLTTVVRLLGAGRDAATRAARRAPVRPVPRRSFRLGGTILVRPGRSISLRLSMLAPLQKELFQHMELGTLRVIRQETNKDLTIAELTQLFTGQEPVVEPKNEEGEGANDTSPENENPTPPEPPKEPEGDVGGEAPVEPTEAPEEPTEEPVEPTEEPVEVLVEEQEPADEPEPVASPLPENWKSMSKNKILGFYDKHNVPLPNSSTKSALIKALEEWETTRLESN